MFGKKITKVEEGVESERKGRVGLKNFPTDVSERVCEKWSWMGLSEGEC